MPRENAHFSVIIAGAGMAGLLLGQLLELANIPYHIVERTADPSTILGSAMGLGPNILPLFEQLGMLPEMKKFSKVAHQQLMLNEDLGVEIDVDTTYMEEKLGYGFFIFTRPDMYNLLLSKVPSQKISWGKKVLQVVEEEDLVTVKFADNTRLTGTICVGADGAYSAVRQSLYKTLDEKGVLPRKDKEDLTFGYYSLLGTTNPMDPAKYPDLLAPGCVISSLQRSSSNHAIHTFTAPGNRFCWHVTEHIESFLKSNKTVFRNSEWGSEAADSMVREVRDFRAPFGGTMADYIDATPKEAVSKVMLEEKLFKTWHGTRTVLIGDACHKMLPSAGQGATNAMQDAVVLANCLYELPDHPTLKDICTVFTAYRSERYPEAKLAFNMSRQHSKVTSGQTFLDRCLRKVVFHYTPTVLQHKFMERPMSYRPQCNYIPLVENRGTFKVLPQKVSKRYSEELAAVATV